MAEWPQAAPIVSTSGTHEQVCRTLEQDLGGLPECYIRLTVQY
jgi:hypothetical protein